MLPWCQRSRKRRLARWEERAYIGEPKRIRENEFRGTDRCNPSRRIEKDRRALRAPLLKSIELPSDKKDTHGNCNDLQGK